MASSFNLAPFPLDHRAILAKWAAANPGATLSAISAWTSTSGLELLFDIAQTYNVRPFRLLVGINKGGTSAQALRAAMAVFAEVKIYRDGPLNALIFHPKVYLARVGDEPRFALIGSPNLTRDGFLNNVEASIAIESVRGDEYSATIADIESKFDELWNSRFATAVDFELIESLRLSGIIPEQISTPNPPETGDEPQPGTAVLAPLEGERQRSSFRPTHRLRKSLSRTLLIDTQSKVTAPYFVRFFTKSEANRIPKILDGLVQSGTFEFNIPLATADMNVWGPRDLFSPSPRSGNPEWFPSVNLFVPIPGAAYHEVNVEGRLFVRIRDGAETELRFRVCDVATVREYFPRDLIEADSLVSFRRVGISAFDVEIILRDDPRYAKLRPPGEPN
jgi:HKD family nuclease